jgi:prepilin-type N-terminal cleavage/methylation domain-containing protein
MKAKEILNSKSQPTNNLQPPIGGTGNERHTVSGFGRLGLGSHWNLFESWDLGVGVSRRRGAARGFTLVELLVSVGLTAILLWGLLQLFSSATKFSSAVSTESELCAAGRALLNRIAREVAACAPLQSTSGYIRIVSTGDGFDSIQFVAPASGAATQYTQVPSGSLSVADDGSQLVHIKYGPLTGGGSPRQLGRGVKVPVDDATSLSHIEFYDDVALSNPSNNDPAALKLLGVRVEQFVIGYIDVGADAAAIKNPSSGSKDYQSAGNKTLPQAILFRIRLRDPRSQSSITLESAAYLIGSGL